MQSKGENRFDGLKTLPKVSFNVPLNENEHGLGDSVGAQVTAAGAEHLLRSGNRPSWTCTSPFRQFPCAHGNEKRMQ